MVCHGIFPLGNFQIILVPKPIALSLNVCRFSIIACGTYADVFIFQAFCLAAGMLTCLSIFTCYCYDDVLKHFHLSHDDTFKHFHL